MAVRDTNVIDLVGEGPDGEVIMFAAPRDGAIYKWNGARWSSERIPRQSDPVASMFGAAMSCGVGFLASARRLLH